MSSREAPNASESREIDVTTVLESLLASAEFSLTLEPFAGNLEPSVWVKLPPGPTIDDLEEVLDYLAGRLDVLALDNSSWLVENEKMGTRKGRSALVVPAADVPRAMAAVRGIFGHMVTVEAKDA
jgi:hypothetical protein